VVKNPGIDVPFDCGVLMHSVQQFFLLMIEARNLSKIFPDKKRAVRAVDDISFRVEPGQIYGLLGANGAGKTTALRLLATLLKPTGGSATVAGFDVVREPERVRANVGFLAASTALYGRLTAREFIAYFGRLNGISDAEIKVRLLRLATELDMHDFLDRRIEKFSTGMKQKVSIARTLIHDPAVMIFDEPTLGLDVLAARTIVRFIRDCRERGKTVIYSTHVMSEVEKICDVIGIVHGGKLRAEGTLAQLRARFAQTEMEEIFIAAVGGEGELAAAQLTRSLPPRAS
jgi:sodium transport system ATP-binding protein